MTLVLDIEHLLGAAFAAREPDNPAPDWPPQPDRVFSALVAAWGARGERNEERAALEWLEAQPAPEIIASGGHPRTAPVVFVPPNDPEGGRVGNAAVMPALRRRQARRFPAFRPDHPVVSLVWREAAPDASTLAALNALAADTAYVGHSASLTRCRFRDDEVALGPAIASRRRVYRGRLAELENAFHSTPLRRPSPGAPVRATPDQKEPISSVFSDRWLVLEHVGGEMPDLRAAPVVSKRLRNTIMAGYDRTGQGGAIPAEVSGHSPDGGPSPDPHLAIAPMAFVGSPYASGVVYGFALIPPRQWCPFTDAAFRKALSAITEWNEDGRRELKLEGDRLRLTFTTVAEPALRSLDPAPYIAEARVWASCTPLVLDRHLKEAANAAREEEIERLIRLACAKIGLPEPSRVAAGRHSALEGAASAYPSGRAPRWMRWRLPDSVASRQLVHAVIEFPDKICGPVILGAGRFVGLGLFRALDRVERGR
jgi:CRISPR-associated protein Csb2